MLTTKQQELVNNNIKLIYKAMSKYKIFDEDDQSNAMIFVLERVPKYDKSTSNFSTFIFMCMEYYVKHKHQKANYLKNKFADEYKVSLDSPIIEGGMELNEVLDNGKNVIDDFVTVDLIESTLNKFKNNKQNMFKMYLKGYKQQDIADKFNCSQQYVNTIIKSIKNKLKEEYIWK